MAVSTWDDICKSVDDLTKKINQKAEQLSARAALQLKLSAKRAELEEQYTALGRLTFERMAGVTVSTDPCTPCIDQSIADATARIAALLEEIEALEQKRAE